MKKIVKDNEFQRRKINIFTAKIEELEQHVGILANSPEHIEPNIQSNEGINGTGSPAENTDDENWESK